MIHRIVVVQLLCLLIILPSSLSAFSIEAQHASRNKLAAALASPSGKLTLSPELVIPEPRDATSILLLSNAVQTLSQGIRLGKANAAFLRGSIDALQTFTNEQATALGNFPGPVPVVYCCDTAQNNLYALAEDGSINFAAIAEAGADGILIPVPDTDHWNFDLASTDEITTATSLWTTQCKLALQAGLQPVPEISIAPDIATAWSESDVEALTTRVIEALGMVPVAVVLTIQPSSNAVLDESNEVPDDDNQAHVVLPLLPRVAKATRLRVPILGSVRQSAGENRLSDETLRYKEAGFAGTVLRSECVPVGLRQRQPNLDLVAKFWQACLTDLKSTRSRSFGFRSKNNLNVSVATKWGNYQKNVIESGALGDPQETASLNEAAGDYQGF
jgi:hypothetical protein